MTELQNTRTLEVVAAEIRTFTASMLINIIEIGRRLCEAKEMVPYGEFGAWVKKNTGYSSSTANNFMRLFQEYGSAQGSLFGAEVEDVQTFGKLTYSKALALLAVPAGEREDFVQEHDVEAMSTRELNEAIRERDAANQKLTELSRAFDESQERVQRDLVEIRDLKERIVELESRPVDVAVQEPDPAEIEKRVEAAVDEALRKAKAYAEEEKKKLKDKLDAAEQARKAAERAAEDQARAAAEKEKTLIEQQAGVTSLEKERLEREIETLKKQIAMSDAAVVTFNTLFAQAQDILNRLLGATAKVDDAETAGKLRAALRKLLEVYGEKVEA